MLRVPGINGLHEGLKTSHSDLYIVSKRRQSLTQQQSQLWEQTEQRISTYSSLNTTRVS